MSVQLHPHRAFWIIGATAMLVLFSSAAPSPLYPVYQDLWGFSPFMLTVVFAAYVVTMVISLVTVGSLSDHVGRRPVLAGSLTLLAAAMVLFLVSGDVGTLIAARALQGLATGAAIGTLTATTVDLQPSQRLGSAVTGAAPTFGLAGGVLIAGLLIEYAPAPRLLIFMLMLAGFILLLFTLLLIPETAARTGFDSRRHLLTTLAPHASVPGEVRGVFLAALPAFIATWSLGGFYLSLGSSVVADIFDVANHGGTGAVLFVFFGSAAVTSLAISSRGAAAKLAYGYPALAIGAVISLTGVLTTTLPVYVVGSIIAGSGFAAAFVGALDEISLATLPAERGRVFSAVYVACYVAFSLPAVGAGIAATYVGLYPTVIGYVAYVLIFAVIGGLLRRRMNRRASIPPCREEPQRLACEQPG